MSATPSRTRADRPEAAGGSAPDAKAAAAWVGQLARTLKTCRLYEAPNPTVVKFREETAFALRAALDESGPWTLRFTDRDVLLDEASLYPARSREDNVALPFYRDGVRALTLEPGIEPREVQALIDAVLQVSGQGLSQDDLVTLLWEADLPHVFVDYVPAEEEIGGGAEAGEGEMLPWPSGMSGEGPAEAAQVTVVEEGQGGRSDDWGTGDDVAEVEAAFEELLALAAGEAERLKAEFQSDRDAPVLGKALALSKAALAAGALPEDRDEIGRFQPRLLRMAVAHGCWGEAREALALLGQCGSPDWSPETFAQELLQPISVAATIERADAQPAEQVGEFVALARDIGDSGVDWLNLVLAESQQRVTRKLLTEAIVQRCQENPERLAPWLSDPRWYVARNTVHILGGIGGPAVTGLLQVASRHPDPRVRSEVVAALGRVNLAHTRPVLIGMLEGADTRTFCALLHQLGGERHAGVATLVMGMLQDPAFEQRPPEEQRSIYSAVGGSAGDAQVADLEAELHRGSWFARYDFHRQQVARVLARVGTPLAREALERNLTSKRTAIRKACEDALAAWSSR